MSKKIILLIFLIIVSSITGCKMQNMEGRNAVKSISGNPQKVKLEQIKDSDQEMMNIYLKAKEDSREENFIPTGSSVSKVLFVAPITGKYSAIGKALLDGVNMAMSDSGSDKIILIPIDSNEVSNDETSSILAKENPDVVLGPLFAADVQEILGSFRKISAPIITFSNDESLTKYKNIEIFGVSQSGKIKAAMNFAKANNRSNVGILLKSDAGSEVASENIKKYAKQSKMAVMASVFYGTGEQRISSAIKTLSNNLSVIFNIDKNGSPYLINVKDAKTALNTTKQLRNMDFIITDAGGNSLDELLSEMLNQGLLNRDVMIISISDQIGTSLIAEKVYYVGYDTEKMNIFEDLYKSRYKAKPTVFSAMGYDAMGVVSTMLLQGKFSYNGLHDSSGFIGVMGDFKFTNSRIVERSYTVYKAQGVKIEKVI